MKRILPKLAAATLLAGFVLVATGAVVEACGPYFPFRFRADSKPQTKPAELFVSTDAPEVSLNCPVVGLGKDFSSGKCPSYYCGRKATLKSPALDYKGGKIYFCCNGCITQFKQTPEKFAANANHQLVVTGQAQQVNCPITGQKPAMSCGYAFTAKVAGIMVAFADQASQQKFVQAKPGEQLEMAFGNAAFAKAFVVKTATPAPQSAAAPTSGAVCDATEGCCCCQPQATTQNRGRSE